MPKMRFPTLLLVATAVHALVLPDTRNRGNDQIVLESPPPERESLEIEIETAQVLSRLPTRPSYHVVSVGDAASPQGDLNDNGGDGTRSTGSKINHGVRNLESVRNSQTLIDGQEDLSGIEEDFLDLAHLTIYEALDFLRSTVRFKDAIDNFPDLVYKLNDPSAKLTIFAPTDDTLADYFTTSGVAMSSWAAREILEYHITPDIRSLNALTTMTNIPTMYISPLLNGPQVMNVRSSTLGVRINEESLIQKHDIVCSNGLIHLLSGVARHPEALTDVIEQQGADLHDLSRALQRTGLTEALSQHHHVDFVQAGGHIGATIFAPSNLAFSKLGPELNAFLFSPKGNKYLQVLMEYHIVLNDTLYSNLRWAPERDTVYQDMIAILTGNLQQPRRGALFTFPPARVAPASEEYAEEEPSEMTEDVIWGNRHYKLSTMLPDHNLGVSISRIDSVIDLQPQPGTSVVKSDLLASDGVLHVIDEVLIPPRKDASDEWYWHDRSTELSVEELVWRLDEYVHED